VEGVGIAEGSDLAARRNQSSHQRRALDDMAILLNMQGGWHDLEQASEVENAAYLFELPLPTQLVGQRHVVDRIAAVVKREHGLVNRAVPLAVEIIRPQEGSDLSDRVAVDQGRSQHGLFGVGIVRRKGAWRRFADQVVD